MKPLMSVPKKGDLILRVHTWRCSKYNNCFSIFRIIDTPQKEGYAYYSTTAKILYEKNGMGKPIIHNIGVCVPSNNSNTDYLIDDNEIDDIIMSDSI